MFQLSLAKSILFLSLFLFYSCGLSQKYHSVNDVEFVLKKASFNRTDTLQYLVNLSKYNPNKPTAVFLNGSMPVPLIINMEDGGKMMVPFTYFDFAKFLDSFNLVLLSKPYVPAIAKYSDLVDACYLPDTSDYGSINVKFNELNNLDYLGERTDFFVDFIIKNEGIVHPRVLIIGHSQGGIEASRVASLNKSVTDVVMLSAAPYGVFQQVLSEYYLKYLNGEMSLDAFMYSLNKASNEIEEEYRKPSLNRNKNVLGFIQHSLKDIVNSEANFLYISGTRDIAGFYTAQLLLDCKVNHKNNVKIRLFEDREHSFFKQDSSGVVDYKINSWNNVFDEITDWFYTNE